MNHLKNCLGALAVGAALFSLPLQAQPHDPTGHGQDRPSSGSTPAGDRIKIDRNDYGESTKRDQNPTTSNSTTTNTTGAKSKPAVKPRKPK